MAGAHAGGDPALDGVFRLADHNVDPVPVLPNVFGMS